MKHELRAVVVKLLACHKLVDLALVKRWATESMRFRMGEAGMQFEGSYYTVIAIDIDTNICLKLIIKDVTCPDKDHYYGKTDQGIIKIEQSTIDYINKVFQVCRNGGYGVPFSGEELKEIALEVLKIKTRQALLSR